MARKIKLLLATGGSVLAYLTLASAAFAAQINLKTGNYTNIESMTIPTFISGVVRLLLIVAFVIAFLFLVIGGIRWILSGGDKAAAESARGTLTAALIGLIIVLAAWAIMWLIEQLFGVTIVSGTLNIPKFF